MAETTFTVDKDKLEVRMTREFNATPERMWRAYTEPEQIEQWWAGTVVETMEVRVGGKWRYISGEQGEHAFRGEYTEVDEPHKLTRTFEYEPMAGHISVESAIFEPLDGGRTRVTMVSKFDSLADLEGMVNSGMEYGAKENIARLAELVERQA